jgi:predicted HD phosphohydrolase|tara:strand:+ start:113 stop:271 length:159 start_codon:yes stop_codon:yes gene_type:complete
MEDPILLGILMFGFLVTSALCHNLVELLQDLNQGDEADEVSEHHIHGHQAKF